jgi:hypothetical protein
MGEMPGAEKRGNCTNFRKIFRCEEVAGYIATGTPQGKTSETM